MRFADDKSALSLQERTDKTAALTNAILLLERAEEQLVVSERLPRRATADPVAVLGIEVLP
jgi:hypothetical protein